MAITDISVDHLDLPGRDSAVPTPPAGAQPDSDAGARPGQPSVQTNILDPGFDLTLRPMRYPQFFEMYRDAIKNTWTVDEIDFSDDLVDLDRKLMPAEKHLIRRLVGLLRHRRLDRGQQPGTQPLRAHQRARSSDVPVAPTLSRKRCTCSST